MKENEKKITVFIAEELHKPARIKIAEADTSFQKVMLGLLREWVDGKRHYSAPVPMPAPNEQYGEDINRLRWILEHGTAKDAEWIRGNLMNFEEAIKSRKPEHKPIRKQARG